MKISCTFTEQTSSQDVKKLVNPLEESRYCEPKSTKGFRVLGLSLFRASTNFRSISRQGPKSCNLHIVQASNI